MINTVFPHVYSYYFGRHFPHNFRAHTLYQIVYYRNSKKLPGKRLENQLQKVWTFPENMEIFQKSWEKLYKPKRAA